MKFKIGDRVRVLNGDLILKIQRDYINNIYNIIKINIESDAYWLDLGSSLCFYGDELELAIIHDSKLARNLYKNQIYKIENGKIYLKGNN